MIIVDVCHQMWDILIVQRLYSYETARQLADQLLAPNVNMS